MKTCTKCNELNGNNRTECWQCNATLPPATYKKICPKCRHIYSQKSENCDDCGGRLSVYSETAFGNKRSDDNRGCWMYIVSVLLPIVGIILGCVYIAKDEDELGKSLIIVSVASIMIPILLAIMLKGCVIY